jgi:hypothetical protein
MSARSKAGCHAVLAPLSGCYPPLEGRSPTCYSPVRHSTQGPKPPFAFDLHVLGTPPALILSQDQTLKLKMVGRSRPRQTTSTRAPVDLALALLVTRSENQRHIVSQRRTPQSPHQGNRYAVRLILDGLSRTSPTFGSAGTKVLARPIQFSKNRRIPSRTRPATTKIVAPGNLPILSEPSQTVNFQTVNFHDTGARRPQDATRNETAKPAGESQPGSYLAPRLSDLGARRAGPAWGHYRRTQEERGRLRTPKAKSDITRRGRACQPLS